MSHSSLFQLAKVNRVATREGHTGQYASLILPFSGQVKWFASGQIFTFPDSEAPQNTELVFQRGTTRPDTFKKDCCDCNSAI